MAAMPPRVGPLGAQPIDLELLARSEPWSAQVGYWLNHPQFGGVNLDGDPLRLSWAEFAAGQGRLLAQYPFDQNLAAGVGRLHQIFALQSTAVAPPASSWRDRFAIELYPGPPQPGAARALGGFTIQPLVSGGGVARIGLPFPTERPHQKVDPSSLKVELVDAAGKTIPGALLSAKIRPALEEAPEKALLVVELDRAALPAEVHLRWQADTVIQNLPLDLSAPVPLAAYGQLPAELAAWLAPAPMIQIADPKIQQLALAARSNASTIQQLVSNTLAQIAKVRRTDSQNFPADFQNDAASFAHTGWGECTAHGNLFAALMRANGIPTRIVNGISRGIGYAMNMHYQNEYWVPGKGWVHVEPQGQQIQSPRADMVQTGIVSPALEKRGRGLLHYDGVHQLTMNAMEIDAQDRPLPPAERTLEIREGLPVKNSALGGADLGLHGAT
jgi:hypothetical protein